MARGIQHRFGKSFGGVVFPFHPSTRFSSPSYLRPYPFDGDQPPRIPPFFPSKTGLVSLSIGRRLTVRLPWETLHASIHSKDRNRDPFQFVSTRILLRPKLEFTTSHRHVRLKKTSPRARWTVAETGSAVGASWPSAGRTKVQGG